MRQYDDLAYVDFNLKVNLHPLKNLGRRRTVIESFQVSVKGEVSMEDFVDGGGHS